MTSVDFVDLVLARMATDDVSQSELARACGLSQPHISRVLNKHLKLSKKTRTKLENWLKGSGGQLHPQGVAPSIAELQRLVRRLSENSPERRMHIMQLLRVIEAVASAA